MKRVIVLLFLINLTACEAHRLGAQFNWEYGTASEHSSKMLMGEDNEKDNN